MPKKGIIQKNRQTHLQRDPDLDAVFACLNSLKPNGATKKEICKRTGLSESKVRRHLEYLQQNRQSYGNKEYIVKREGYVYEVVVYDQDGSIIDYGESFKKTALDELKAHIGDVNALTAKEAIFVNDTVILFPMTKRARKQIKTLLSKFYGADIKDIISVDSGLYLILSTDDKDRFNKTKESLIKLYKESI